VVSKPAARPPAASKRTSPLSRTTSLTSKVSVASAAAKKPGAAAKAAAAPKAKAQAKKTVKVCKGGRRGAANGEVVCRRARVCSCMHGGGTDARVRTLRKPHAFMGSLWNAWVEIPWLQCAQAQDEDMSTDASPAPAPAAARARRTVAVVAKKYVER
jgi:hypothetical protein